MPGPSHGVQPLSLLEEHFAAEEVQKRRPEACRVEFPG